jgi:hypothetical protein
MPSLEYQKMNPQKYGYLDTPKSIEILPNTEKEKKDENNFQLFLTEYKNTLLVIGLVAVGYYLYKKNK